MALLDYLAARRSEIEAQLKTLRAELAEIRIAENALTGASPATITLSGGVGKSVRAGSIKDWVLKALAHASDGLDTDAIRIKVNEIGGPDVSRNSMTPQLSRLKAGGLIDLEGRLWRLAPQARAQKNETPGVSPPGASNVEEEVDVDNLFDADNDVVGTARDFV